VSRRIAAVVLAAGASRRMGGENKLAKPIGGVALVARVVDAVASEVERVHVVTGADPEAVRAAVAERDVEWVHNAEHARGMGTSIAAGVSALPPEIDAVLVCLGDMPRLDRSHVATLRDALEGAPDDAICVPVHEGRRGHPVLFAAAHRAALERLEGDRGARALLEAHPASVVEVAISDDGILADIDTPEDYIREL
jgi:molybdenum cofactor cytidylyltransferase